MTKQNMFTGHIWATDYQELFTLLNKGFFPHL